MIKDKSTTYDQTVHGNLAKAGFWHVWPKRINPERSRGFGKRQLIYCPRASAGSQRIGTVPRVLLESTVSLASHSLFIVVTISRKCCQATAFHDRRNCTKGRHDVDNLRSHLLLRANQSRAWPTHTRWLTNVLDVKAADAGSRHPFPTLLFKTKYYFNSGRCQGFKSVELCLRWRGNLSAHMPRILRRPTGVEDKGKENGGSFFSFKREKKQGKKQMWKSLIVAQPGQQSSYLGKWFQEHVAGATMGPFLVRPSVRATWHTMQTLWIMQSASDVTETGSRPWGVGICCRVSDHEMSAHRAVQCWKQTRWIWTRIPPVPGTHLGVDPVTQLMISGHHICSGGPQTPRSDRALGVPFRNLPIWRTFSSSLGQNRTWTS